MAKNPESIFYQNINQCNNGAITGYITWEKLYAQDLMTKIKTDIEDGFATQTPLEKLLETSDVISLHINYLPENHYFIDKEKLSLNKKEAIFINTSRGLAVNTEELLDALDEGILSHACLDVLEFETSRLKIPPKENWDTVMQRLAAHPKVTLTPHIAGQTFDADKRHADFAFEKIIHLINNKL